MNKLENESNVEGQSSDGSKSAELANELRDIASKPGGDRASQDGRLDHDVAWDVGHASKRERSEEAYYRQLGQLASETDQALDEMITTHASERLAQQRHIDSAGLTRIERELQESLRDKQDAERRAKEREASKKLQELNNRHFDDPLSRAHTVEGLRQQAYYDTNHEGRPDPVSTEGRVKDAAERAEAIEADALRKYKAEHNNE